MRKEMKRYALVPKEHRLANDSAGLFEAVEKATFFYARPPVNGDSVPGMEAVEIVLDYTGERGLPIGHMVVLADESKRSRMPNAEGVFGNFRAGMERYQKLKLHPSLINLVPVFDVRYLDESEKTREGARA